MKIVISIFIICACGAIGLIYKNDLKEEINFLKYIKDYGDFCCHNIAIFKNDLSEITNNYLISIKNKTAKYSKIFIKTNRIYQINKNYIQIFCKNKSVCEVIFNYISAIGNADSNHIEQKHKEFSVFIDSQINNLENQLKMNGDLVFKVALSVGAILAIILW